MRSRDDVLDAARVALNADPTRSMADLAAAIGVGRATLHRHFATREALLHEIGERSLDSWARIQVETGVAEAAASDDPDAVRACLDAMLTAFVASPDDYDFALTDPTMQQLPDLAARAAELQALEVRLFTTAQRTGVVRRDVPAAWLSHLLLGLLIAAREAVRAGDVAVRPLPDLVLTTFHDGAAPR